ncbi:glycosyl transferase group 1 [Methanocaldococcus infernus ME]|uniref:Glycosyl transferase group 1 n=1 Tax=Methanocaldococcus infernus (strain DSM 11812 / JCM 15783 / ME) TaxID=573063 RepID=D5VU55_METIM|nr:glycosyltransferase [Methanocaldococcus infernus]ADG14108.1 glycosyl transferase group 1 [Methanocaldococcus infernus ME]
MDRNILIVISSLKKGGGAEKVAYTLGNLLEKVNFKVYFLNFYKYKEEYFFNRKFYLNEKLEHSIFSKLKKLVVRAKNIARFSKINKINLIISFMEEANFSSILAKTFNNNLKVIISIRQDVSVYTFLYRFLIKLLYPKADKIVAVSKEIEEILIKEYKIPKEKIKTIYNPHSIEEYQKLSKEPLEEKYKEIFKDSFVFINIGRLTEQKGQWFLIRAFKKVSERHPEAKLIILGEGGLRNKLEKLIKKLNLEDKVFLLGRQDNVFKFLKNSDCFVFSSLWEGLPNTVIEALSVNLPIISTDCKTGPREILAPELDIGEEINYPYYGKYGILTKPFPRRYIFKTLDEEPLIEEEKILAELMIKIIKDKELREKYSNGLERAKDFDIDKIVKEWEGVIKKVLNNKN